MSFGRELRDLLSGAGKSQRELSHHLGVSQAYVSDVIRGTRAPFTIERILATSSFLDLRPGAVLDLLGTALADTTVLTLPVARGGRLDIPTAARLALLWDDLGEDQLEHLEKFLEELA